MYRGNSNSYHRDGGGGWQNPRNRPLIRNSSVGDAQTPSFTSSPHYTSGQPGRFRQSRSSPRPTTNSNSNFPDRRRHMPRQYAMRDSDLNTNNQEKTKLKITGIPQRCSAYEVYKDMRKYGSISRIEIVTGRFDNTAYIIFPTPPSQVLWNKPVFIGRAQVRVEPAAFFDSKIPSPVNPAKKYSQTQTIFANSIDFGVQIAETTMVAMHSVNAQSNVEILLDLKHKELSITFPLMIDDMQRFYRFQLPFAQIDQIHLTENKEMGQGILVIPFKSPPKFFRRAKEEDIHKTFNPSDRIWSEFNAWYRMTDIVDAQTKDYKKALPIINHKSDVVIDIGRWTTYRICFHAPTLKNVHFKEFQSALVDHGITIINSDPFVVNEKLPAPMWEMLEEEIGSTHPIMEASASQSVLHELLTNKINLKFSVRYQFEVCLSNGYLKEHTITRSFLERLSSMTPDEAIYILEKVMSRQDVCYDPMAIFDVTVKGNIKKNVPSYCVLSRSATITPTKIHVASPIVETSNRIIRKHEVDSDRFIRIKFSDEKTEGRIYSQSNNRSEAIFERITQALTNGIVVAGRYYEFLAFGSSQFREHGAYFYAPTWSNSADTIRLAMGSFQHIKSVSKFGARMGQCFSTTRRITSSCIEIQRIPDVERNGFTFTDGVGKISFFLAQMAAKDLGLQNPFNDPPSLFQFRLAGCKGVLALDPSLMSNVVCIRPSQYKFEAPNVGLEVIRSSAFASACLNRQLIIVLSTLGVSNYTFIRKQQEMVNNLEQATTDENMAIEKLQSVVDFNQITLTMAAMILDGFMATKDPFMMSLLHLWRAFHIKYLKEKARIMIEKGAFVLGCVDETATLRGHYDDPQTRRDASRQEKLATLPEIFLRISDPEKRGFYKVIEGHCILARNPSLHAGDIRIVRAVNKPALHHIKNAVVLPQTGERDIANMCSGGDLDGDDYLVMWDEDLLPETINEVPMDFTPEKPIESKEPITIKSVTDFFVTYMKNDSLSRIALAHLAQADYNEGGVREEKCLELARLHSQAVDYPKSGLPAVMDRSLFPWKYPHFMENKHRPAEKIYRSKKILGMLFDQVDLVNFKPQYENPFDGRILNAFELDDKVLKQASSLKDSYDTDLRRLMAKHAIRTEFEAWSVFVLSHNQESRDYTFAEDFGRSIAHLKKQYRDLVEEASGATSSTDKFALLGPFVAAMYVVTARDMEKALIECRTMTTVEEQQVPMRKMDPESMPLISFPWLFVHELGKIATKGSSQFHLVAGNKMNGKPSSKPLNDTINQGEADIQTSSGVTHYGEPLALDFTSIIQGSSLQSPPESLQNSSYSFSWRQPYQGAAPDSGSEVTKAPSNSDRSESEEISVDLVDSKLSALDLLDLLDLK